MAQKILKKAQWFWEDYVGAKWNNVEVANSGEGQGSYVHPQGKNSKSQYKPKSLFYHYQVTGLDSSKHKLDDIWFVIMIRKFNPKENDLPTIKVFTGDNNAPYKTAPIKTVSTYTKRKNDYWYDNYTLAYKLNGVTISQLKNVIIEVDWSRTKVNYATTISVNRGRLEVNYSLKDPKWSIYDYVPKDSVNDGESMEWKITAKNSGYNGKGEVDLTLPKGTTLVSSRGEGSFNPSTKVWTFSGDKGETRSRYFKIKYTTVGNKTLTAKNKKYPVNATLTRVVSVNKTTPKPTQKQYDSIYYTFYDTFMNEERQYFDVQINGVGANHTNGVACYTISTSANVELYTPLVYPNVYILSESDDRVYSQNGSYNNKICLNVESGEDFEAHLRIFMKCTDDTEGTIHITSDSDGRTTDGTFDIIPPRKNIFIIDDSEAISRDKTYVPNSVSIGSPLVWNINAKPHRHNFFDEKKDLMEIEIEKEIAYIGVIPLSRCHKADVTATSKNTLIENRYLNRAYYGKKGDYSEDIKMTLRIPWYDVATLQGLCEMDKPIPIDTIPNRADGDPLNHRGWAEIHEVGNIKKINDMLYECDVGVTYLSHDILTRFTIAEAKKITEANIKYYLSLIHNYNEDLLDLFTLNYYEFWTTLEDANGDKVGSYSIDPNTSLKLTRDLNHYSTYDIIYRNTLPQLMSEDYDGNWEMALRVLNKGTGETLFEHNYSNFKHYDFSTEYAVNTADATSKYLVGGNYETLNFEKVGLGYDSLSPLIEDNKVATHFNSMENITISDPTDDFEVFLLDSDNNGVSNEVINVKIANGENYSDSFNLTTDIYGRAFFKLTFGNGDYNITFTHKESEKYRACTYNTDISINFNDVAYHFEYENNPTILENGGLYTGTLLDDTNTGVSGMLLHYSFKEASSNSYGYERTVMTENDGSFTIPVDWSNGTKKLRVTFKGFVDNGTIYEPVSFEEEVNINITGRPVTIEADDVVMVQGDDVRLYNIILKNDTGEPLADKQVNIAFYNNELTFVKTVETDNYGVASVPLYLVGDSWAVDVHYKGDIIYKPNIVTRNITIQKFERKATYIESRNLSLDEDLLLSEDQEYYTITLLDDDDSPVVDEPVSFTVENGSTVYVDTVLVTDENGTISFPFVSHSENVIITADYKGCVRYEPTTKVDEVVFANKTGKADVTFSVDNSTNSIKVNEGNNSTKINENSNVTGVIVTKSSNERQTTPIDIKYYTSLNSGTFKVTVLYQGNATYHPTMRTVSYTHNTDTRLEDWAFITDGGSGYSGEPPYFEDYETGKFYGYPIWSNWDCGIKTGRWYFLPHREDAYEYYSISDWRNSDYKSSIAVATQRPLLFNYGSDIYDSDGIHYEKYAKWGFDAKMLFIEDYDGKDGIFLADDTDHYLSRSFMPMRYLGTYTKDDATLTQTGFAYNNETYQNIEVDVTNANAELNEQINEYFIMKLTNTHTLEQLFFYSYLIDKTTISKINFLLAKGTYELEILGQGTTDYNMTRILTTGTITTDTDITIPQTGLFADSDNYTELEEPLVFGDGGFSFER